MTAAHSPNQYIGIAGAGYAQDIQLSSIRSLTVQMSGSVFGVPAGALCAPVRRTADIAFARQVAMYMAHVFFGLSLTRVGMLFGRDRTTVAHACAVVEDRREDAGLDRALSILETALQRAGFTAASRSEVGA